MLILKLPLRAFVQSIGTKLHLPPIRPTRDLAKYITFVSSANNARMLLTFTEVVKEKLGIKPYWLFFLQFQLQVIVYHPSLLFCHSIDDNLNFFLCQQTLFTVLWTILLFHFFLLSINSLLASFCHLFLPYDPRSTEAG